MIIECPRRFLAAALLDACRTMASMLRDSPPDSVSLALEQLGLNGEPPLLSTPTDINLLGGFQRQWLIVNDREVAVLSDDEPAALLRRLPVGKVESFRANGAIGSGLLQAQVDGMWVDLLRYTNSHAD